MRLNLFQMLLVAETLSVEKYKVVGRACQRCDIIPLNQILGVGTPYIEGVYI